MKTYLNEIKKAMKLLDKKGYLFIGQSVRYSGTSMTHTLKHINEDKKIEVPVFEDTQLGMSTGLSLTNIKVVSIFPRMDFMLLCCDALINHLDKFDEMSDGMFKPSPIIRTCIGSKFPMMPGPQHCQNYYKEFKSMCKNINVVLLDRPEIIYEEYKKAMNSDKPTILIEMSDLYNQDLKEDIKESKEK